MIFVIIFACLFVLGISVKALSPVLCKTEYGTKNADFVVVLTTTISFFGIILYFLFATMMTLFSSQYVKSVEEPTSKEAQLYSLNAQSDIKGDAFLGCGSISNQEYYAYFTKDASGYKKCKVKVDDSRIKMDLKSNEHPYLEIQYTTYKNVLKKKPSKWLNIIAYNRYKNNKVGDVVRQTDSEGTYKEKYIFHIPEGSIKENYDVN